jgi:glutamate/tyrosine decarboxylase-like PLP-dependent enzyme
VARTPDLELLSPPSLGVLCFRYRPSGGDWGEDRLAELNEAIQQRVIQSGTAMISSTRLRGAWSLRLCILSHQTTWEDLEQILDRIEAFGRELAAR